MYVFIKFEDSIKIDLFGPATQGECESWMRLKKIYPRDDFVFNQMAIEDKKSKPKLLCE